MHVSATCKDPTVSQPTACKPLHRCEHKSSTIMESLKRLRAGLCCLSIHAEHGRYLCKHQHTPQLVVHESDKSCHLLPICFQGLSSIKVQCHVLARMLVPCAAKEASDTMPSTCCVSMRIQSSMDPWNGVFC